jgi:hypothetical protein
VQQEFANPLSRFMQLRLRIAHRAPEESCDLAMFVSGDLVQQENLSIPARELAQGPTQRHAIDAASQAEIGHWELPRHRVAFLV